MPSHDRHPRRSSAHRRPASCLSCKSRKLRCNRESPCSNCVSRNVSCQQPAPIPRPARVPAANRQLNVTGPEILGRLLRLENLMAERPDIGPALRSPSLGSIVPDADNVQSPRRSLGFMPKIQDLETDAIRLEKLCKVQSSLVSLSFPFHPGGSEHPQLKVLEKPGICTLRYPHFQGLHLEPAHQPHNLSVPTF